MKMTSFKRRKSSSSYIGDFESNCWVNSLVYQRNVILQRQVDWEKIDYLVDIDPIQINVSVAN